MVYDAQQKAANARNCGNKRVLEIYFIIFEIYLRLRKVCRLNMSFVLLIEKIIYVRRLMQVFRFVSLEKAILLEFIA